MTSHGSECLNSTTKASQNNKGKKELSNITTTHLATETTKFPTTTHKKSTNLGLLERKECHSASSRKLPIFNRLYSSTLHLSWRRSNKEASNKSASPKATHLPRNWVFWSKTILIALTDAVISTRTESASRLWSHWSTRICCLQVCSQSRLRIRWEPSHHSQLWLIATVRKS